ncbi:MAG TPA: hypothetical protein PK298_09320 [Chitinophagaceae bacterium]|nr:hypothetical protein [Chitinophagaceae bacterium]
MKYILIVLFCMITSTLIAQEKADCNTLDVNKVPGKWVWQNIAPSIQDPIPASQWKFSDPIRKEMQRIMPLSLDGLHATNSIAFPKGKAFWYSTTSPAAYECYLMLKKFECLKGYNELKPEAVTGCWAYFSMNQIEGEKFPLPEQGTGITFNQSKIRVTNIEVQTDATGNKIIYSQYRPDEIIKHCYFFSGRKDLPWRKMSNSELFTAYKTHHEKRVKQEVLRFEKLVADDQKKYNGLSAAEKQNQNYWPEIIRKNKEILQKHKDELEKISNWYNVAMQQSTINAVAYVTSVNESHFYPERLMATPENGYNAWVDNLDFFDKTKPKDEPQCIAFFVRRDDDDLPKKNFMDLFHSQFNMDVLAKMVGEPAKKPNGINNLNASVTEIKKETNSKQEDKGPVNASFDNTADGQFPMGWLGMKNAIVQTNKGSKWLTITKDGYWYPRQYNKAIKDKFNLSFDLQWNEDIAYNSGSFTVTLGDIDYDNTGERYRLDDNQEMFWSLYNGYAGNFNRVILWFDPYWNGGGTLTVYSYDKRESLTFNKRIVLPDFYKDKNNHKLQLQRKGNGLVVIDNGKTIADLRDVFLTTAHYNIYTFSRYKGEFSDNKNDVFYLGNIKTTYE